MGKLILRKNGLETQLINGEDFSTITPESGTYVLGFDAITGKLESLDPNGNNVEYGSGGDFTGGTVTGNSEFLGTLTANVFSATTYLNLPVVGLTEVTYLELVDKITGSTLTSGAFYLITDFQTCYDQPDFDYDGNPITTGNYKQGPIEPIMVLATNTNTISEIAYQPSYPKDRILYDWSWGTTEVTGGVAFGRITERIDEFNNRTDYDHRNILFKRYKLFTQRDGLRLNGTIEITSTNLNNVTGTTTQFTNLSVGDVIYVPGVNPSYFEIIHISGDTLMSITGDTLSSFGSGLEFYKAVEETNGGQYFSIKRTNINSNDFVEYTTFGDAISQNYAINNYVGNFSNNYQNAGSGTFLLANNVFLEGGYESNKFGDYCYNNTFGTDNSNNIWGDWCYENVSTNDIDDNVIGHSFNRNLINTNLTDNHIGNDFSDNQLLAENGDDFEDNIIGNGFNSNVIYSRFYKNEILDDFNNNTIGDFANLDNFTFYRNYIRNGFNGNAIYQDFQNNQVGTNFQDNSIYGEFVGNTILNGFNNNNIGTYFNVNVIGNAFNNNTINDNFYYNTTQYYFNSNIISNDFTNNTVGTYFQINRPSNIDLFGWSDLSTVSTRTYDVFNNIVGGGQLGNKLLGKELVMRVTPTSQYFLIKFKQWTQNGNGGGFQYERTEIDSSGNIIGPNVVFTKLNNGNEIDVIIPGVLEITRGNNNGIYNTIAEGSWNSSISPSGTTWNSIYTEPNNGERFAYNKIGNNFYNNIINSDFGYGGGDPYGNVILDDFKNNTIGQFAYNNVIGNRFTDNIIGDNFENNSIKNYFRGNTIGDNFENNEIGNYFGNNGGLVQNTIFNNFRNNKIGNYFGNDTNYPSVGAGTNNDGGNIINDNFQFNDIGDNFIYNAVDLDFQYNKMGTDSWFNVFGTYSKHNVIGDLFVGNGGTGGFPLPMGTNFSSNKIGNYAAFNFIGTNFINNDIGDYFGNAGSGTENNISNNFNNNKIGNYFGDDGSHTSGGNSISVNCNNNLIGTKFYDNYIEALFYRNDIGNEFFENNINDINAEFHNNEIGNRFNRNTTSGYFYANIIGGGFNNNTIGDGFYTNEIGFGYNNNNIGQSFGTNFIGYYFSNNTVGNNFYSNKIMADNIASNIIGNDFRYNVIDAFINGIDFTTGPATHVYGGYNCTIFTRQDASLRLSYYDNSDVLNIVNITD